MNNLNGFGVVGLGRLAPLVIFWNKSVDFYKKKKLNEKFFFKNKRVLTFG